MIIFLVLKSSQISSLYKIYFVQMKYYIQVDTKFYPKTSSSGLIDSQNSKYQSQSLKIDGEGELYFNIKENLLEFVGSNENALFANQEEMKYVGKIKIQGKTFAFFADELQNLPQQRLYKMISTSENQEHSIIEKSELKLGKVVLNLLKVVENPQQTLNYLKQSCNSVCSDDAVCRICYEPSTQENFFVNLCKCEGSSKYIHKDCLIRWISTRVSLVNINRKGMYYSEFQAYKCQLCLQKLPLQVIVPMIIPDLQSFIIMTSQNFNPQGFYIIEWIQNQIIIGRGSECDLILSDSTVSRKHCKLILKSPNTIGVLDLNSKFKTLLKSSVNIINQQLTHFQKGKIQIFMQKKPKKSWLNKLTDTILHKK